MKQRIQITQIDHEKLLALASTPEKLSRLEQENLPALLEELGRAELVEASQIDAKVVTLNSRFRVQDQHTGEVFEFRLVQPHHADPDTGRISILSSLGVAVLGYAEGDEFVWPIQQVDRRLTLHRILYQPEAHGEDLAG